jgi:transposase
MTKILLKKSPETLKDADMEVFSKYRRGETQRYAHLLPAIAADIPPHAPSDAHWSLVQDLIPERLLMVRGKPPIMDPRKFLHAIFYMVSERVRFGGLPKSYFGCMDDIQYAMRKLVRHHLWDTMVERFQHFDGDWAASVDLTIFDWMPRSKNETPEFRAHRVRSFKAANHPVGDYESAAGEAWEGEGRRLSWSDAA